MMNDLQFALRQLRKSLGFTLMAVATLALGIAAATAAATAVFSLVDTVLLRPHPFPEPDRILVLNTLSQPRGEAAGPATIPNDTSYPNFFDWRTRAHAFTALASYQAKSFTLSAPGATARRIGGQAVSADFFRVLGIAPLLGRTFLRSEEQPSTRSVIVTHALWQSALNADPPRASRLNPNDINRQQ